MGHPDTTNAPCTAKLNAGVSACDEADGMASAAARAEGPAMAAARGVPELPAALAQWLGCPSACDDGTLARIQAIAAAALPTVYRTLLVHDADMTPTLERHFGATIHLDVRRHERRGDWYLRESRLLLLGSDRPVALGVIAIHLAHFPAMVQPLILQNRVPLGSLLHLHRIPHRTRPAAWLRFPDWPGTGAAFGIAGTPTCYGRVNRIERDDGEILAEIVEILTPTA